jgi:hypothetical protein
MNARLLIPLALVGMITLMAFPAESAPVGTGFTYQGRIDKNSQPYTGTAQLLIRLYDALNAGGQIGPDANLANVAVAAGIFTVELDFGAASFNGDARWIEIQVKTTGDANYTLLTPRQKVTAVPYGVRALNGGSGGSQWISDGPDLTYPTGGVGVTGASSPFASGKGVFLEGGSASYANVFAFNYDNFTPLNLILNSPGGRVGLGTTAPQGKLHVESSSEAAVIGKHTGNWVGVYGESQGSAGVWGNSFTGVGVQGSTASSASAGVYGYATDINGWGGVFRNLAGGLALFADGKAAVRTLDIIGGADIVEGFETGSQSLEPGTVVVIDEDHPGELRSSRVAYDHHVAGVVSGAGGIAPGLKLGQEGAMNGKTPVAMSGRVYVRCSAEKGAIHPGDLLTTACTAGCAMRARDAERSQGAVLGKAMSTLDHGTGLVLVLVNLQ